MNNVHLINYQTKSSKYLGRFEFLKELQGADRLSEERIHDLIYGGVPPDQEWLRITCYWALITLRAMLEDRNYEVAGDSELSDAIKQRYVTSVPEGTMKRIWRKENAD